MAKKIDIQIGNVVRNHRLSAGVSADAAAKASDLSLSKYVAAEDGCRRFRAGELYELTKLLDVPIAVFFEDTAHSKMPKLVSGKLLVVKNSLFSMSQNLKTWLEASLAHLTKEI